MADKFNRNFDLDLPAGLDRALLRTLSFHVGRERAILRSDLLQAISLLGFNVSERAMRAQISQLRKAGHLICSAPGENGGYYLPATPEEFDEFVQQEYRAKIVDMQETLSAMQKSAERTWGRYSPSRQLSLFG